MAKILSRTKEDQQKISKIKVILEKRDTVPLMRRLIACFHNGDLVQEEPDL